MHRHSHTRTPTIGCVLLFPLFSHSFSLFFPLLNLLNILSPSLNLRLNVLALIFLFANEESEREREKKFSRKSPVRLKLQSTYICHNLYATHSNKSVGTIRGTHTHTHKYTKAVKKKVHTLRYTLNVNGCNATIQSHVVGRRDRAREMNSKSKTTTRYNYYALKNK